MNIGKDRCNILKNIRLQIAHENEIPFQIEACTFEGNCKGTCPRSEAELLYLEQKIAEKKQLGKRALVAGISLGLISTFSACNYQNQPTQEPIVKKDTISTVTLHKDTLDENVPPPGYIESYSRVIITVPAPIRELSGVDPDLPFFDTTIYTSSTDYKEIAPGVVNNIDSIEVEKR